MTSGGLAAEAADILIVDDQPANLRVLAVILSKAGYRVRAAPDARLALEAIESKLPDLVLLDVKMPGMDGYEMCRRLKAAERSREIPVVFVSGAGEVVDKIQGFAVGGVDYIAKPFDSAEVVARVNTHVRLRQVQRSLHELNQQLERKIEERTCRLRESEERYRLLVTSLPVGVYQRELRQPGRMTMANPAAVQMLGYDSTEEALAVDRGSVFVDPAQRQEMEALLETTGVVNGHELRLKRKDGSLLWARIWAHVVGSEEHAVVEGIIVDTTDIHEAEQRQTELLHQLHMSEKMGAIGQLAGGIAHDFNNVLAAIIGFTELAQSDLPDHCAEPAYYLSQSLQAAERARTLVAQILAFSRQTEQEKKPIHVSPILREVVGLMHASLPSTIEIQWDIQTQRDTVLGDPTQIHQVLMNLCTNAGHAMRGQIGVLTLNMSCQAIDEEGATSFAEPVTPGDYLVMTVGDTGPGMDETTLRSIFVPFFTTKPKGEGTGMGLAVVHGIVGSHQGAVRVESAPGKGTTFEVFLPLLPTRKADEQSEEALLLPRGRGEHILLVDDETWLVELWSVQLRQLGYGVLACSDSVEAWERFRAEPDSFALVLTDQTMPHKTGLDLAREILALRPNTPVIVCTGYSEGLTEEEAQRHGIKALLKKPVSRTVVAQLIRQLLDEAGPE